MTWTAAPGVRRTAGYAIALAGNALLVVVLLGFRGEVDPLSIGRAFLAWVIVSAAVGGLGPGVVASVVAFLAFNYFFIPPYDTFRIDDPEHVVVLFVFLGISTLIAALLARADARAEAADERRRELQLQQDLARALVEPTAGDENYRMVLQLLGSRLRFTSASLLAQTDEGGVAGGRRGRGRLLVRRIGERRAHPPRAGASEPRRPRPGWPSGAARPG